MFAEAFDPDGHVLATCGHDGTSLWDVENGELRTTFDSGPCLAVAFSPDNRILVTANDMSAVGLRGLSADSLSYLLNNNQVFDVAFDAEGGVLVTGSRDRTITLWKIVDDWSSRALYGHSGAVSAVVFHPGGGMLASAGFDCIVRL